MNNIKKIQQNGVDIYPVTHEKAVFDNDGISVGDKINELSKNKIVLKDYELVENIECVSTKQGVNILDFGAIADNSEIDNYDCIMNAIRYAVENNIRACFIPPGTFYIANVNPIYIPGDFTLYGVGSTSVIKKRADSYANSSNALANQYARNSVISQGDPVEEKVLYNYYSHGKNIYIHDLCVDGSIEEDTDMSYITDITEFYGLGINLTYVGGINLSNVEIKNTANTGLYFYRSYNICIRDCEFHGCGKNAFVGTGVTRNGVSVTGTEIPGVVGNIITNCKVYDNGDMGIQCAFTPLIISNNQIYDNGSSAIESDSAFYSGEIDEESLGDIIVIGNYIRNHHYEAMNIAGDLCSNKIITNNIIRDCGGGIFVSDREGNHGSVVVADNVILDCVTNDPNKSFITYHGDCNCKIMNNQLLNNNCTQARDIAITSYPEFMYIANNTMNSTGSSGMWVRGNNICIENNDINANSNIELTGAIETLRIINNKLESGYNFFQLRPTSLNSFIFENNIIKFAKDVSSYATTISSNAETLNVDYLKISGNRLLVASNWKCGRLMNFPANFHINKCFYTLNDFADNYASWGNMINFETAPTKLVDVNNIK